MTLIKKQLLRALIISTSLLFILPFAIGSGSAVHGVSRSVNKMYLDKRAQPFVASFIRNNAGKLSFIKQISPAPFAITDSVFSRYKLPLPLKYLAVIESELNSNATSRVGAVGPWQLMPKTAQLLGLKVTDSCDERTQYGKSTKAAALYLKDLYAEFGDWLLVLAAYNGGPGAVYRAMHLSGSRNFWEMQNYLPAESRKHVKKFIAAFYYFEGQSLATSGGVEGPSGAEGASGASGGFVADVTHQAPFGNGKQGLLHREL